MVQNLTWSVAYLRITLSYDILQKVLKSVPLTATRHEVYVIIMNTVLSDSYASLKETLNHLKSIKLKYHLWYMLRALKLTESIIPSNLDISPAYLRILLILDSISGQLRSTRRLWSLLRIFVCATYMSCNLMRSLPMGPLFKRLCANTTTLLTPNSGNPLIVRIILKMSLYF